MHKSNLTTFKAVCFVLPALALYSFSNKHKQIQPTTVKLTDTTLTERFKPLYSFMMRTVRYPLTARENNVMGRVVAIVTVDDSSHISEAKILRGIGSGCDEEVVKEIRLFKNDLPTVKPGVYKLPVLFLFDGEKTPPLPAEFKNDKNYLDEMVFIAHGTK
ncbi:TonB-like protein [Mucilaginibacter yixingensis]|uniref:TonB-like protein n=1 Tax=Mucilaginibacter yixingensis TaxID=1295612 RepID=A0A2T5JG06_9SPHI|nr:energy transducer TonB [Mucilaginibacter yixingensis]PTR01349.1 TonB-like protein [Mucilaginibacter yixingensis]